MASKTVGSKDVNRKKGATIARDHHKVKAEVPCADSEAFASVEPT